MKNKFAQVMGYIETKRTKALVLTCLVFCFSAYMLVRYATAGEPTNIKPEYGFAWGENTGWFNFGSHDGGVMVTDTALTGYVWSENLGWISLNCSNDDSCSLSDYKVANDGEGNLTGYAWGENIGWVNFAPSNGGVHIDSDGVFSGYAWSENTGWIVFSCRDLDVCLDSDFQVKTTWIPVSARNQSDNEDNSEGIEVRNVLASSTDTTITIYWDTTHDADSHVRYGKDKNLEEERNEERNEKKHRLVLRDLDPNTEYYFRVKSTDTNDMSDTSKIYSVFTKPASAFFDKRQRANIGIEHKSENDGYERVDIDVTDKIEKDMRNEEDGKGIEIKNPERETSILDDTISFLKEGIAGFFSTVHGMVLHVQKSVVTFFGWTGDRIAGMYDSAVSRFSKEKETEIVRLNQLRQAELFTTEVFNRNDTKMLAEVKFQILDKSDNPVSGLETTLFSDPKTTVTDDNGIAAFRDVPIGSHTLAFDYQGESFRKKVAIADTLTDEGGVRAEIVQVKAEKERIALWMWGVIALLIAAMIIALYFSKKYYALLERSGNQSD